MDRAQRQSVTEVPASAPVHSMPASAVAAAAGGSLEDGQVAVMLEHARNAKLQRLAFVCGWLYVVAGASHLVVLPVQARPVMVMVALACAAALFGAYGWLRRRRATLNLASRVCALFYVTVIVHSLLRFGFAHGPADLMFIAALMVALSLLPARPRQHDAAVVIYVAGWSAVLIQQQGFRAWTPYVAPLAVVLALSIAIRHLEYRRSLRYETLRCRDARRQRALRASQQRYALAARGANDGLFEWEPPAEPEGAAERTATEEGALADRWGASGGTLYLSPRWKGVLGYPERALSDNMDAWVALVHPDDRATFREAFDAHLAGRTPHLEVEYRIRRHDGRWAWMLCRGLCERSESGGPRRLAGSQTDITERRAAIEQLAREAKHDALTGLPNRAFFTSEVQRAFDEAREGRNHYAVLYLDLDRFKLVNDSLGHHIGDRLLVKVAERIAGVVRPGDVVARFGGDEFGLLLNHLAEVDDAGIVAARLHEALTDPFAVGELKLEVCGSVGIAVHRPEYDSPTDLLRDADTAMYQAKRNGLDSCVFDGQMRLLASERLSLEQDLRGAVQRDELRLYYQPIVDLRSGGVVALEALVRWQHPGRGLLGPDTFVPVAEETGLMATVGAWVLEHACRDLACWAEVAPTVAVSINCSAGQLAQPAFEDQVRAALDVAGVAPERVWLELTEQVLIEQTQATGARVRRLLDLGLRLCIDDFGVGYSSLGYLQRYAFDVLKLDRSFIAGGRREQILQSMVMLASGLGMDLVAEGIESEEQLALLRRHGFTLGQGFYFARPLPAAQVPQLLQRGLAAEPPFRATPEPHLGTA